ncbi:MAG: hypothetical protein K0S32_3224 [Bacteroidetes bacterium]|jgi:hypothetical protein|nr:hypothetical protein [Bacteroidota bacterium]
MLGKLFFFLTLLPVMFQAQVNFLYAPQIGIFRFQGKVKSCKETEYGIRIKNGDTTKTRRKQRPSDYDFHVVFNANGKISEQTFFYNNDKVREVRKFYYDADEKLIHERITVNGKDSGTAFFNTDFFYNTAGKPVKEQTTIMDSSIRTNRVTKGVSDKVYTLDSLGRKTQFILSQDGKIKTKIAYKYNAQGDLIEEKVYNPKALEDVTIYAYDNSHRCTEVKYSDDGISKMKYKYAETIYPTEEACYSAKGLVYRQVFKRDKYNNKTETYRYDNKKQKPSLLEFKYEYDSHGNWIKNRVIYEGLLLYEMYRVFDYYE